MNITINYTLLSSIIFSAFTVGVFYGVLQYRIKKQDELLKQLKNELNMLDTKVNKQVLINTKTEANLENLLTQWQTFQTDVKKGFSNFNKALIDALKK